MKACWLNGSLVAPDEANISVFDHGLLYGDGVFEGIRFYRGAPFRLDAHMRRLERSARALALELPYPLAELAAAVRLTAEASGEPDGYLRLVVTRGEGSLGIDPRSCPRANVFVLADRLQMTPASALEQGARLIIASTRRLAADQLDPRIKSLNYLNQIMGRIEANHAGADEAVLLNRDGFVAEGTADNLFIALDGTLMTPPLKDGALDGITRQVVFEVAASLGIPCREQSLAVYDLYTADECFLSGTGAELIPVSQIQGRVLAHPSRPIFAKIQAAFTQLVHAEVTRPAPRAI
jgi:branched-chain amino acid aminotransferase